MSASRLDSLLFALITSLFALLLFLLPLLFSMKSSEVFEFPKMLFVYAMAVLIVACWIARMIVNRKFIYTKTPLDIPIYFFLLSQLFSTFFSIDVHTSIHGYYSRWNGGLLSTIAYTLLYVAYTSNPPLRGMQTEKGPTLRQGRTLSDTALFGYSVHRLLRYSILASATIVSLYAILQRAGIDRDLWIQDVVSRVFSTQGQPNWLAGYLVMVFPLSLSFLLSSRFSVNRFISYSVIPLIALAIAFTRSRSGLIGFVVTDLTFWSVMVRDYMSHQRSLEQQPTFSVSKNIYGSKTIVHHLYSSRLTQTGRLIFSFLAIHALIFILLLSTNNSAREFIAKHLFLQPSSFVLRPSSADAFDSSITSSSDIRRIVWTGALQLVKERPLFGWGPETFAYTYWRVRPVEHNLTSEWNFLYNKAHNEWLNLAANTGLFGLGTHLLLVIWFACWSILTISRITNHESRITIAAILAAILGVESVNFFGFSTVTTQAYSYIFMGIAVAVRRNNEQEIMSNENAKKRKSHISLFSIFYFLLIIIVSLYLLSQISISFLADLSYNRGKQFAKAGYVAEALDATQNAVDLVPDEPVFRSELAETQGVLAVSLAAAAAASDSSDSLTSLTTLTSLKDSSLTNFAIVERQSAANISFLRTRARVTYVLGSLDPPLYDQGIALMSRTMELAPTDPKIPYNLGVMLLDRGRTDDARKMFEKAMALKPDDDDAKRTLEDFLEE